MPTVGSSTLRFTLAPTASAVAGYQLWTANDNPGRDPAGWTLYRRRSADDPPPILSEDDDPDEVRGREGYTHTPCTAHTVHLPSAHC